MAMRAMATISPTAPNVATWIVAAAATVGVIVRPWDMPEATWAVLGAAVLVAGRLLPPSMAWQAVGKGTDVYLFLTGMMLLSEMAAAEGLFAHMAARAARAAGGSPRRLFGLVFAVGVVVTALLSNDATAVVLTPAVYAAATAAAADPLPYLFICAFVANAASFVLPISNPANLVVFSSMRMPPLGAWLGRFALPSALAIGATYVVLRATQRSALRGPIAHDVRVPVLSGAGQLVALGIGSTSVALLVASARGVDLGWQVCLAASITALGVSIHKRATPASIMGGVSWSVLPLVAGLFVLVAGLETTGVVSALSEMMRDVASRSLSCAAWSAGIVVALATNLINNLPAGLLAGSVLTAAAVPPRVSSAVLIGVDLGPNLSVTGSLATILWLVALRRAGQRVSFWRFLALGALVMPPALLLALAAAMRG